MASRLAVTCKCFGYCLPAQASAPMAHQTGRFGPITLPYTTTLFCRPLPVLILSPLAATSSLFAADIDANIVKTIRDTTRDESDERCSKLGMQATRPVLSTLAHL